MNFLDTAKRVFADEISSLSYLADNLDERFSKACELLKACQGKVVVCGMGKSGHIGKKIAATLASTGTPAFFMHPGEANHGDLGMLDKKDVLIGISNSGETSELIGLLPVVKRLGVPTIAITNKTQSSLGKHAEVSLDIMVRSEACSLGLAPTTSTTATLMMGDALAVALLESKGFSANDFALSHPGGSLGKRLLLSVNDVMVSEEQLPLVKDTATVSEALLEMSKKGLGITGITSTTGQLLGVFSDGDLRRALDKHIDVHKSLVKDVMTKGCVTINCERLAVDALNIMQDKNITALFVMDSNKPNNAIGAIKMHDLLKAGVV